jgi:hypothetical protein
MAAPPAPVPEQKMMAAVCRLLEKMCVADRSLPKAISLNGNSVLFRKGDELTEIAKIQEHGDARIFLKDVCWDDAKCKAFLGACHAPISEDRLKFLFMHKEVYFRMKGDGFALCASNKRESEPLIYFIFNIE